MSELRRLSYFLTSITHGHFFNKRELCIHKLFYVIVIAEGNKEGKEEGGSCPSGGQEEGRGEKDQPPLREETKELWNW